jgi:type II secretory pathway component PulM
MIANLKTALANLKQKVEPQLKILIAKWNQLQPREQKLVGGLGVCLILTMLFLMVTGLIAYKARVDMAVKNLNSFVIFSKQAALKSVEANTFTSVSSDQIKGDVTQVLQTKDPDILIQDGQMTITVPNAQFSQVMTLLDQMRRSYAIFPSQLNITKQSRAGYVSFNATFWVKQ